jgi:hypothetical protein
MPDRVSKDEAEALHARLVWLIDHCDQSRTELAAGIGRHQGTITPWFAKGAEWSLPDAKGLMALLRVTTVNGGHRLSERWLMRGEGPVGILDGKKEGTLVLGAQMALAEVELYITRYRDRLMREVPPGGPAAESASRAVDPRAAAGRLAETDRLVSESKKKKKKGRRQAG